MPRTIESSKSITWAEAKDLLDKRIKEGFTTPHHDMVYRYLEKFSLLSAEDSRKLVEELVSSVGIDEEVAVVIANICPMSTGEVRSILEMRKEAVYKEEIVSGILETVKKYCGVPE